MISSEEAYKIVIEHAWEVGTEEVSIEDSIGRILAEDIFADRNFPPFDRVMMDGIAISYTVFQNGRKEFSVEGMQTAGIPKMTLDSKEGCFEVMTGAILPEGVDTVIKFEEVEIQSNLAKLTTSDIRNGQHVHREGSDRKLGEVVINSDSKIRPSEIAVLSTVGKSTVKVKKNPCIAIVSTGDELVGVDETPLSYQIRTSNSFSLKSHLSQLGIDATTHHINDDKKGLKNALTSIIDDNDIVILSGGVSRGKKDYVPEILEELKVEKLFHRVSQRPGKPFWFGNNDNTAVFALPGNPVSTFMCFHKFTVPFIHKMMKQELKSEYGILQEPFKFAPELTYFLQVKLEPSKTGQLLAFPVPGQGSGDLANLTNADAFMELPMEKSEFLKGEAYEVIRY